MATVNYSNSSAGRASSPTFRVSTREISLDLQNVGPAESPNELGALNETAFRELLGRFASIPAVKLLDGDPQLVVSAKRGRYLVMPSGGQLLVRSVTDAQQPFTKFHANELPAYLDSTDQQPASSTSKASSTLVGAASAAAASRPPVVPAGAPIYGDIPVVRLAATSDYPAVAPATRSSPPPVRRGLIYGAIAAALIAVAGAGWIIYGPTAADEPAPARPPAELEAVTSSELLDSLKKRYVGTYATSGDTGERLLELRADGSFHYQEFGAGISTTANRYGTYTFALRHGNKAPVIRASSFGTIELREDKSLVLERTTYTRLP